MLGDVKETVLEIIQAVLPVTIIVIILQFSLISMPTNIFIQFLIGTVMVTVGLILFMLGIKIGLLPLGEIVGAEIPKWGSAVLVIAIAFILGFAVTVAEPDVRILANQVDFVSNGEIGKSLLITMVALGVGIFVGLAMLRIILGIPLSYILGAGYIFVLALSFIVPSNFVPIAFDAGGVTTGPLTVPFILALGIGVASVLGGKSTLGDSFGLIGLASIGPIIAVMILGVITQ